MVFGGVDFSVHKEGFRFISLGAVLSFVLLFFSSTLAWIGLILTAFCAFFFRNPKRLIVPDNKIIVSPADGKIVGLNLEIPPSELGLGDSQRYRVSICLSIFDVHVNRIPVDGTIKNIVYQPGSFLNATLDKASVFNEKNTIVMEIAGQSDSIIAFSQIAGVIARRIVCEAHEGQSVKKGEIFGLIRFGSRCDVWLPVDVVPQVSIGQTMIAGETILADLKSKKSSLIEGILI